jgi:N-acetylneuraminate lyase
MIGMIRGLVGAVPTPMKADGHVNYRLIEKMAQQLTNNAVNTAFVGGTMGEFSSLTLKERTLLADKWVQAADVNLQVMVHVGDTCLASCIAMAKAAAKAGAHAIAAVAPYYFKPGDQRTCLDFCQRITEAAPDLPFYYYHVPDFTGVNLPIVKLLEEGARKIPSLAGVIFDSEDLTDFGRCVDAFGDRLNLLLGRDDLILAGLKVGAHGVVGVMSCFAAQLLLRVMRAYNTGDMGTAQNYQVKAVEILAAMRRGGVIPSGKYVMQQVGLKCGPVRPPLRSVDGEQSERLEETLDRLGLAEFCNVH